MYVRMIDTILQMMKETYLTINGKTKSDIENIDEELGRIESANTYLIDFANRDFIDKNNSYQNINILYQDSRGAVKALSGGNVQSLIGGLIPMDDIRELAEAVAKHIALRKVYKVTKGDTKIDDIKKCLNMEYDANLTPADVAAKHGYYSLSNYDKNAREDTPFSIRVDDKTYTYNYVDIKSDFTNINIGKDFGSRLDGRIRKKENSDKIFSYFTDPTKDMFVATIYNPAFQLPNRLKKYLVIDPTYSVNKTAELSIKPEDTIDTKIISDETALLSSFILSFVPSVIKSVFTKLNPNDAFDKIINSTFTADPTTSGFDLGMSGGYNENVEHFLNVGKITGLNVIERMISAYNISEENKNIIEAILQIHTTLFKKDSEDPVKIMYALIMKYFHKKELKFSSIYNQIIFPNILYGSAIFRYGVKRISEALNELISKNEGSSSDYKRFKNIQRYLNDIVTKDLFNNDYVFTEFKERKNVLSDADPSNIHTTLSIVNEHLNEFIKKMENRTDKGESNMLFCSNFPSIIQQIDMVITIITMIIMVVKETGIYDPALKKNRSIVNSNKSDPFGLNVF